MHLSAFIKYRILSMNILIPHNWLLEHLETAVSPAELQKIVSLSGPSIERIYDREGDQVYDIEVTTNRVDSMSVRGIAREAAVILAQAGKAASLKPINVPEIDVATNQTLPLPKIINNPALCKRIMCVVLDTVQHTATPEWMAKRLKQIEQNVHDSVIDITNYITHELGHPCHAFDYDKIMQLGGVITVVEATSGKKFTTLDGETYETVGGEVVFENEQGEIIDLPAIKGTANTAVDSTTQRVLFWIESLNHKKVRFASMKHAIRTVAAQLNEKQVDPYLADAVLARGVELYQSLCHACVASTVYDEFSAAQAPTTVLVQESTFSRYLGIEIATESIAEILEKLGCQVQYSKAEKCFSVEPPSFRPDIEIEADVVEEIARIYGYHNLPSTLMNTAIPTSRPEGTRFDVEHACKLFLAHIGWQEVYTYSLVSGKIAQESGYALAEHVRLQNPLTDDRVYLRRSLVPSLVEVLDANPQRPALGVFEIAHSYHPQPNDLPIEELHLTLIGQKSYPEVRGDFERLLRQFYITQLSITEVPRVPLQQGEITATTARGVVSIGTVTILEQGRVVFDLLLTELAHICKTHPTYQPLPKAEAVTEDLTFSLPERTPIGTVIQTMIAVHEKIASVKIIDQYKQNFTFSYTYLDPEKSLSKDEVEPIRRQIIALVAQKFSGALVGTQA